MGEPVSSIWWANYDPETEMPRQQASWTCSACALAWVLRATAEEPGCTEQQAVDLIGYPENINPTYGLMDGSGAQLQRVLASYNIDSNQGWLTFDAAYALYSGTTGMMSRRRLVPLGRRARRAGRVPVDRQQRDRLRRRVQLADARHVQPPGPILVRLFGEVKT